MTCSKCPDPCVSSCSTKCHSTKNKNQKIKFRLVQYGKVRKVKKNQCAPKLKCQDPKCQSYAACVTSRCRRAMGLETVCTHVPELGGKLCYPCQKKK